VAVETESGRYALPSIIVHWAMLLLLVGVYAAIELREFWPKGTPVREAFKTWHFMLGLSVFFLVWIRIGARLLWAAPTPPQGPAWRNTAAAAVHFALYFLMIAMPLAGWLILSAEGDAIPFFGFTLPPLMPTDDAIGEQVKELHEMGGTIGYWLIGLHAAASLFHHYILKDGLLARMRPAHKGAAK